MGTKQSWIWRTRCMFVLLVYCACLCVTRSSGHTYPNQTQLTLCQAQCETLCLDKVPNCEQHCNNGGMNWMTNCNSPNCSGTCSVFLNNFNNHQHLLEPVPIVSIYQSGKKSIELSWTSQVLPYNYTTIYIIEETRPDPRYHDINTVSLKGWVRGNKFQILVDEVCNTDIYRIMAINEYGSRGYSLPTKLPGLRPGLVEMIHYVGQGIYYNKDLDPSLAQFMAILEWEPPQGWSNDDIYKYEWNPLVRRYCDDTSHDSIPVFTHMVRAISKCHVYGPWTAFTVELTNCRDIVGYPCQSVAFDPPGLVKNVSLAISSTPYSQLLTMFSSSTLNPDTKSPLLINLHVNWRAPSDMGSQGVIDHYVIRSGKAKREMQPIPPTFIGDPTVRHANSNIIELIFELPTESIPYTYGVQITAVAPGQVISDNQWGMFPMYTIQVGRNNSIGDLQKQGKVLLDKAGIVIVYVNNTLPVHFLLDDAEGRSSNLSINRYALQWGPLVGPNQLEVENFTILPLNQTVFRVFLLDPRRSYGIKKLLLPEDADDPSDTDWGEASVLPFTMPRYRGDGNPTEPFDLIPLYILSAVIVFVAASTFTLVRLHKRRRFKNLERRLINPDDHDIDENNDHYFVMRMSNEQAFGTEDIPTITADRWELPHCCLKTGRVLGSGAFGQVVKGRVSKSVLFHRGIDFQGRLDGDSTHVTVAIKMLQEFSNETCSRDFLNEIQLMKAIGYHRNIVSILGCCTLREPYCLVVEHLPHGDLLSYLQKIGHKVQLREEENGHYINQTADLFSPHDLLSVARQVSIGMEYMSQKGFVHRDLAARNILVGKDKNVKIGDFGLARYIYDDIRKIYVNRRGGKLPLRWLSPESIFDLIFSTASDVWSFGILLFEIVTLGGTPYPRLSNTELVQNLKQGYKMDRPDNCCRELFLALLDKCQKSLWEGALSVANCRLVKSTETHDIMTRCWNHDPDERPNFTTLRELFTSMLEEDSGIEYFDFQVSERDRVYFCINSDEMDNDFGEGDDMAAIFADSTDGCNKTQTNFTKPAIDGKNPSTNISDVTNKITVYADVEKRDLAMDKSSYSDSEFMRTRLSNSSFHNGLYSVPDGHIDGVDAATADDLPPYSVVSQNRSFEIENCNGKNGLTPYSIVKSSKEEDTGVGADGRTNDSEANFDTNAVKKRRLSVDRTSGSSDEVFTDCPGCVKLSESGRCMDCGLKHLSPCDFCHEDSAIGSTNSDDLNPDSDNTSTSTISEEYIMPDSPTDLSDPVGDSVTSSKQHTRFDYTTGDTMSDPDGTDTDFPATGEHLVGKHGSVADYFYLTVSMGIQEEAGTWTVCTTRV